MTKPMTVADARDHIIRTMPEKTLQAFVVQAARSAGWAVYHTFDSRRSEPGFPDLVMIRGGRMIAAELKRHKKQPTEAQERWLNHFRQVSGAEVYVWTPTDWVDRRIIETLETNA